MHLMIHQQSRQKREKKNPAESFRHLEQAGLASSELFFTRGKNLFETLLLNLVMVNGDQVENEEKPLWESDTVRREERTEIPFPDNLAELYTLQSRRVFLERENDTVIRYYLIGGDFFQKENAFMDL